MSDEMMAVHMVKLVRKDPAWPKYRLINGQVERIVSEDAVPEVLYSDEYTTEWREHRPQ